MYTFAGMEVIVFTSVITEDSCEYLVTNSPGLLVDTFVLIGGIE